MKDFVVRGTVIQAIIMQSMLLVAGAEGSASDTPTSAIRHLFVYRPNTYRMSSESIPVYSLAAFRKVVKHFGELASLGIKTIISVDGAIPDITAATKIGLAYVHLPHGYDGIPDDRVTELAKAVRDLNGPIYIHCHHGKHRSPAATSVACVSAGLIPPSQAVSILEVAGTDPHYL